MATIVASLYIAVSIALVFEQIRFEIETFEIEPFEIETWDI